MRTRISLAAVLLAGLWATAALAANPAQIYNDYVRTGNLSCSYSRGELEGVLQSGSINQYGDPLTLARLKLAARRHLAGGCRQPAGGSSPTTASGGSPTKLGAPSKRHRSKPSKQRPKTPLPLAAGTKQSAGGSNSSFVAGRALIVGLLAVALAFAGWLTKRGLSARD